VASGTALRNKINGVLTKLHASVYPVYLRVVTTSGGNPRLGLGGTTSTVDTLVTPPPVMTLIKSEDIATSAGLLQMGDYECILPAAIEETALRESFLVYGVNQYRIVSYDPMGLGNVIVAWKVHVRPHEPGES
jgi:hypothetical protein